MADQHVVGYAGTGSKAGRFLTYAVVAGGYVFTTGSRGFDPETFEPTLEAGELPESFADEVRFALLRQRNVLREAGSDLDRVVNVGIWVNEREPSSFEEVDDLYASFFSSLGLEPPPHHIERVKFVEGRVAIDSVASVEPPAAGAVSTLEELTSPGAPFLVIKAASEVADGTCAEGVLSCLQVLDRALAKEGCQLDDVVHVMLWLPNEQMTVEGYVEYNVVYREFFSEHGIEEKPARSTVGVSFASPSVVRLEAVVLRPKEA